MPIFGADGKTGDGLTKDEFTEALKDNGYSDADVQILFQNG